MRRRTPLLSPHSSIFSINYLLLLALPSLSSPPYIFPPHPSLPFSPSLFPLFIPAFLYSLSSSPPSPLANSTPSTLISLSPLPYPLIALLSLFILPSHPSLSPFTSPPFLSIYLPSLPFSISTYLCAHRPLEFQSVTVHSSIQLINRFFEFLKLHFSSWILLAQFIYVIEKKLM